MLFKRKGRKKDNKEKDSDDNENNNSNNNNDNNDNDNDNLIYNDNDNDNNDNLFDNDNNDNNDNDLIDILLNNKDKFHNLNDKVLNNLIKTAKLKKKLNNSDRIRAIFNKIKNIPKNDLGLKLDIYKKLNILLDDLINRIWRMLYDKNRVRDEIDNID